MKNFFKKQSEILAILLYVIAVIGLVYFIILPLIGRINGISDQIQQELLNQEGVKLHIEQLPKMQKQFQDLQNNGELENVLLKKEKAVVLIEKLEELAESTGNEIKIEVQDVAIIEPVKKSAKKGAESSDNALILGLPSSDYLQMKIILTGEYNSIIGFIALLEKFEYYSDITIIQINKSDNSAKSPNSISNSGMFGSAPLAADDDSAQVAVPMKNEIAASLNVVFYTN